MGISERTNIIWPNNEWKELHPQIVRRQLPATDTIDPRARRFLAIANISIQKELAQDISDKLSHNAYEGFKHLGPNRPQSAFYTLKDNMLAIDLSLATERGKIHHDLMREQNPEYESMKLHSPDIVRSGHFGNLTLPSFGTIEVAMIESLGIKQGRFLLPEHPEFSFVTTLANNRIVPVNAGGFPVQIIPKGFKDYDPDCTRLYTPEPYGVIYDSRKDSL